MRMRARVTAPDGVTTVEEIGEVAHDGDLAELGHRAFERFHQENPDQPLMTKLTGAGDVLTITISRAD